MLYFSYGSNMSFRRLSQRITSARFVDTASLTKHQLKFHKAGSDSSAKCDAHFTDDEMHIVHGVVFDISKSDKIILDRYEGLGAGYDEKMVIVNLSSDNLIEVSTYYATNIDLMLKPFHWYKEHVLVGARENDFPNDYISKIAMTESIEDHDQARHDAELEIYFSGCNK